MNEKTAGGAGTIAITKRSDLQKSKDWHREHVRRVGSNTSTQPQECHLEGKLRAVGKVEIIEALRQKMVKEERNNFPSPQNGRPVHSRSRTWNATRLRDTESVITVALKLLK